MRVLAAREQKLRKRNLTKYIPDVANAGEGRRRASRGRGWVPRGPSFNAGVPDKLIQGLQEKAEQALTRLPGR